MARSSVTSQFGIQEYFWQGVLSSTSASQSWYVNLQRSPVVAGVKDGEWLHPTDYWATKISEAACTGEWNFTKYGGSNRYRGVLTACSSGSLVPIGWTYPGFKPEYLNRAIIDARIKLQGDHAVNFLQNYAERQQAIDLVADRLTAIAKSYRFARKKRWKQAFRALGLHNQRVSRRMSENVLAWNYGVAPLASDIRNAIDLASDPPPEKFLKVVGVGGNGGGVIRRVVDDQGYLPRTIENVERHLAKCVMWVKPENEAKIKLAATQIHNLPLLAYELIPFSFLLDWVVPISDWLQAMGATAGWSFYSGYTMERTESINSYGSYMSKTNGASVINSGAFRHCKQFRRTRLLSFPIPGWMGFKNPFSLVHALNAVALFGALRRN